MSDVINFIKLIKKVMIVSVYTHEIPVQLINQHFEIGIGGVGSGAGEHMILYFELLSRIIA